VARNEKMVSRAPGPTKTTAPTPEEPPAITKRVGVEHLAKLISKITSFISNRKHRRKESRYRKKSKEEAQVMFTTFIIIIIYKA